MNTDALLAPTTPRPRIAWSLALAVLLSLGACGGSDDGDASPLGAADPVTGESGAGALGDPGVSGLAGTGAGTDTGTGAGDPAAPARPRSTRSSRPTCARAARPTRGP